MNNDNMLMMSIVAIVALFTLAVGLYGAGASLLPGHSNAAPNSTDNRSLVLPPTGEAATFNSNGMRTAFGALSITSADPAVKGWMEDKKIVYVAGISSDFCSEGLSDTWTITYASDDGQIMACVVRGVVVDARSSRSSPQQGLDPAGAIDSVKAWQTVSDHIAAAGGDVPASVSMALKVTGGRPRWDVSYQAPDGFRIVRVDAGNDSITDTDIIG